MGWQSWEGQRERVWLFPAGLELTMLLRLASNLKLKLMVILLPQPFRYLDYKHNHHTWLY